MTSIDLAEIARFSTHAEGWWDPNGALRPLHKINPVRIAYIRDTICARFDRKISAHSLKDLSILDIGCGGGILCEPLARLGARVTGLDASEGAIDVARAHASQMALDIDYRSESAENFARGKKRFDVITALEVLEHVADISSLLRSVSTLLKPNGTVILSTLNRTPKSFVLGIIAAEYILKWVPRGTHDWRKFIRPSELATHVHNAGMRVNDIEGMIYDPLNDCFELRKNNVDVNYFMTASN